jgi:hypothetical protein
MLVMSLWMQFLFVSDRLNVWTLLHFSRLLVAFVLQQFCPAVWWWDINICLVFSEFIYRPTLLASCRTSLFFLMIFIFSPNKLKWSAKNRSWCVPFNSNIFFLCEPPCLCILKQILKMMMVKHLLVSDHPEVECVRQMFTKTDFTIVFI